MTQPVEADAMAERWVPLDRCDPAMMAEARLLCHWAAQPIAAFGRTRVSPAADDSHTGMSWDPEARCLVGQPTPEGVRLRLRLTELKLQLVESGPTVVEELALEGRRLAEALDWLGGLSLPDYEMPEHAVKAGAKFPAVDSEAHAHLERWYANAALVTRAVRDNVPGATPPRCWPHHFDLATLVNLDDDPADPESARSINVGMSPGDSSYNEPYFYVNPWPRPNVLPQEPPAGAGHWHLEGWFGAVLPATDLRAAGAREQAAQTSAFVNSAIATGRALLLET